MPGENFTASSVLACACMERSRTAPLFQPHLARYERTHSHVDKGDDHDKTRHVALYLETKACTARISGS
jgi:hypothetical protein